MKRSLALLLLALLLTAVTTFAQSGGHQGGGRRSRNVKLPQADYDAVKAEMDDLAKAWNAGDVPGMSAHMVENVEFITPTGMAIQGKKELQKYHAELMKKHFADSRQTLTVRQTRFIRPRVGFCDVEVTITHYKSLPPGITLKSGQPLRMVIRYLLTREGRGWFIAAGQSTLVR